jgi:acetyl esterase/lipase
MSLLSVIAMAAPLSWTQLTQLPLPPPGEHIAYGAAPQQFGELRLPAGRGPFPAMLLVHGGCWLAEYDYVYFTRLGAWLAQRGVATFTIEYRRLGDPGGGWPGTFLDVGAAADALRTLSAPIDLERVYAGGHSAGGQLALWLAARARLPSDSPLHVAHPQPIRGVLGLAAITDLDQYRIGPAGSCHASVEPLLGGAPSAVAARYAQTSPLRLLPLGVRQVLVQGEHDPIVDLASVRSYVNAARAAGDAADLLLLPALGHFDPAVAYPGSENLLEEALRTLLAP